MYTATETEIEIPIIEDERVRYDLTPLKAAIKADTAEMRLARKDKDEYGCAHPPRPRWKIRGWLLAYGYLRGRSYRMLEATVHARNELFGAHTTSDAVCCRQTAANTIATHTGRAPSEAIADFEAWVKEEGERDGD